MEGMSFEQALADLVAELGGAEGGMLDTAATYAPGISVQDGRPSLENDYSRPPQARPRPADAMQPVAETLATMNPLIAAQAGGQMAGSAYNSVRQGDYLRGAGEAALAAGMMVPAPAPRPMGAAAQTARRATMREAFAPRPVNPITPEQIAAQENRLLALQSGRPANAKDVPMPKRDAVDPQYWSAPAGAQKAVDVAPYVGAAGGAAVAGVDGGDPVDVTGGAAAGGLLGLAARYGGRAAINRVENAARARGPVNADEIIAADRSYSQGLDSAAQQQQAVNRLLTLEEQARVRDLAAGRGPQALPPPGRMPDGMNYQLSGWGQNRRSGFVDPMADPRTPIERMDPRIAQQYESQQRAKVATEQREAVQRPQRDASRKMMLTEHFVEGLGRGNRENMPLEIVNHARATGRSVDDVITDLEKRGWRMDYLPHHVLQQKDAKGRFMPLSDEHRQYHEALRRRDRAREQGGN